MGPEQHGGPGRTRDSGVGRTRLGPAPTQSPLPAMQPSCSPQEEDPETYLLALLRWVQRGDTSGVREREAVDRRRARAGQTWKLLEFPTVLQQETVCRTAAFQSTAWHFLGWRHLVPFDTDNLDT